MGRGNRGAHWTESHGDRQLWTPEQEALARTMSQEAYEALYGRAEKGEGNHVFHVPLGLLGDLEVGTLGGEQRMFLLSGIPENVSPAELVRDPVFRKLHQREMESMPAPLRAMLEKQDGTLSAFAEDAVLYRDTTLSDPEFARDLAGASLLCTAVSRDFVGTGDVAPVLAALPSDERVAFTLQHVLPHLHFLNQRDSSGGEWKRAVWNSLQRCTEESLSGNMDQLAMMLRLASGENSAWFDKEGMRQAYENIFESIGGEENLGALFRDNVAAGQFGPVAHRAVAMAITEEIKRQASGSYMTSPDFESWLVARMRRWREEGSEGPLEGWRELFQEEGNGEMLGEVHSAMLDPESDHLDYRITRNIREVALAWSTGVVGVGKPSLSRMLGERLLWTLR